MFATLPGDTTVLSTANLVYPFRQIGYKEQNLNVQMLDRMNSNDDSRYTTTISCDRRVYRPGETVFIRGFLLHALNYTLPMTLISASPLLEIISPKKEVVKSEYVVASTGTYGLTWTIPTNIAGGDYNVSIKYPNNEGFSSVRQTITIMAFGAKSLINIQFLGTGYAGGDVVHALATLKDKAGNQMSRTRVFIECVMGLRTIYKQEAITDVLGDVKIHFMLPEILESEDVLLTISTAQESRSRPVPIILGDIDVSLYPEGGLLVEGVYNRVYLSTTLHNSDPLSMTAKLCTVDRVHVDRNLRAKKLPKTCNQIILSNVNTSHHGRGSFVFRAEETNNKYHYCLDFDSVGAQYLKCMPQPSVFGVGLSVPDRKQPAIFGFRDHIAFTVSTPIKRDLKCTISKKDHVVSAHHVTVNGGQEKTISVPLHSNQWGVMAVTCHDLALALPVAERLFYREPPTSVNVSVVTNKLVYGPGEEVTMTITTSVDGVPVPAAIGVDVTSVQGSGRISIVPERDLDPRMAASLLLESEFGSLQYPEQFGVPLPSHEVTNCRGNCIPESRAVDDLLGTAGWRQWVHVLPWSWIKSADPELAKIIGESEHPITPIEIDGIDIIDLERIMGYHIIKEQERILFKRMNMPMAGGRQFEAEMVADMAAAAPPQDDAVDIQPAPAAIMDEPRMFLPPVLRQRLVTTKYYAHVHKKSNVRDDFTDTVLWHSGIILSNNCHKNITNTGTVTFKFTVSDIVGAYDVRVDAAAVLDMEKKGLTAVEFCQTRPVHPIGVIGTATSRIRVVTDITVDMRVPSYMTLDDVVGVTIELYSSISKPLDVTLTVSGPLEVVTTGGRSKSSTLHDSQSLAFHVRVPKFSSLSEFKPYLTDRAPIGTPLNMAWSANLTLTVTDAGGHVYDTVLRNITILPRGFSVEQHCSGTFFASKKCNFSVPSTVQQWSLYSSAKAFPTPVSAIKTALQKLIREPFGCFEQTSSTVYPMVMTLTYLNRHSTRSDNLDKLLTLLKNGYEKLISFEVKGGGFEWFGQSPAHEALTAYGLAQFLDMKSALKNARGSSFAVDDDVINRTYKWLQGRHSADGGFLRNPRSLDSFGSAAGHITDAYIVWSLVRAARDDVFLRTELDRLYNMATNSSMVVQSGCGDILRPSDDSYFLGLVSGSLYAIGDTTRARKLASRISKEFQTPDGVVSRSGASITCSRGESLQLESTSMAVLSWLSDPQISESSLLPSVESAIRFIISRCKDGVFGSTQGTVLALKALVQYEIFRPLGGVPIGTMLSLDFNGESLESVPVVMDTTDVLEVPVSVKQYPQSFSLTPKLVPATSVDMPWTVSVVGIDLLPQRNISSTLSISSLIQSSSMKSGSTKILDLKIRNSGAGPVPGMIVAVVGLPSGLVPVYESLSLMQRDNKMAFFEIHGNNVVFYWRGMNRDISIGVPVVAEYPGQYAPVASYVYEYYNRDNTGYLISDAVNIHL